MADLLALETAGPSPSLERFGSFSSHFTSKPKPRKAYQISCHMPRGKSSLGRQEEPGPAKSTEAAVPKAAGESRVGSAHQSSTQRRQRRKLSLHGLLLPGIVHYKYLLGVSQNDSNNCRTPATLCYAHEIVTHDAVMRSSGFLKDRPVFTCTHACLHPRGTQQSQNKRAASD